MDKGVNLNEKGGNSGGGRLTNGLKSDQKYSYFRILMDLESSFRQ